jgi:hypothetical protein
VRPALTSGVVHLAANAARCPTAEVTTLRASSGIGSAPTPGMMRVARTTMRHEPVAYTTTAPRTTIDSQRRLSTDLARRSKRSKRTKSRVHSRLRRDLSTPYQPEDNDYFAPVAGWQPSPRKRLESSRLRVRALHWRFGQFEKPDSARRKAKKLVASGQSSMVGRVASSFRVGLIAIPMLRQDSYLFRLLATLTQAGARSTSLPTPLTTTTSKHYCVARRGNPGKTECPQRFQ